MNDVIYIGAFRHGRDNVTEMAMAAVPAADIAPMKAELEERMAAGHYSRSDILATCATTVWRHNPPGQAIIAQALLSQGYETMELMGRNMFVLNFYEDDPDQPGTFSSRESMALSVDGHVEAAEVMKKLAGGHGISDATHSIKDRATEQAARKAKKTRRKAAKAARRRNR